MRKFEKVLVCMSNITNTMVPILQEKKTAIAKITLSKLHKNVMNR